MISECVLSSAKHLQLLVDLSAVKSTKITYETATLLIAGKIINSFYDQNKRFALTTGIKLVHLQAINSS